MAVEVCRSSPQLKIAKHSRQLEEIIVQMAKSRDINEAREIFSKHAPERLRKILENVNAYDFLVSDVDTGQVSGPPALSFCASTFPKLSMPGTSAGTLRNGSKQGFRVLRTVEHCRQFTNVGSVTRGEVWSQTLDEVAKGIYCIPENRVQLAESNEEFTMPVIGSDEALEFGDLESLFESHLDNIISSAGSHAYFVATAHEPAVREQLGLPPSPLAPSELTLRTRSHFPGIHSPYVYISSGITAFTLHKEDFNLPSRNLLHRGMPKLWLTVPPAWRIDLETKLSNALGIRGGVCDQFLRHQTLIITPSFLRESRIPYDLHLQTPGQEVEVRGDTYHCGINLGCNIAEAINDAGEDWTAPPCYTPCARRKGWLCPDARPFSHKDFEIGESRPLDINVEWEASTSSNKTQGVKKQRRSSRTRRSLRQSVVQRPARKRRKMYEHHSPLNNDSASESVEAVSEEEDPATPATQLSQSEPVPPTSKGSDCAEISETRQTIKHSSTGPLKDSIQTQQSEIIRNDSPTQMYDESMSTSRSLSQTTMDTSPEISSPGESMESLADHSSQLLFREAESALRSGEVDQDDAEVEQDLGSEDSATSIVVQEQPERIATLAPNGSHREHGPTPASSDIEKSSRADSQTCQVDEKLSHADLGCTAIDDGQHHLTSSFSGVNDGSTLAQEHREDLLRLGHDWLQLHDELAMQYPQVDVFHVLNLASSVATPLVIKSLIDAFREGGDKALQDLGFVSGHFDMKSAWASYRAALYKSSFYRIYERMLSVVLTMGLSQWEEQSRKMLLAEKKRRRFLGVPKSNRESPKALAVLHYLSHVTGADFEVMRRKPELYKAERATMDTVVRDGKKYQRFDRFTAEICLQQLWLVLPKDGTIGELDRTKEIYVSEYVWLAVLVPLLIRCSFDSLSDDALVVFQQSLRRLRPFIWKVYSKLEKLMAVLQQQLPIEQVIIPGIELEKLADVHVDSSSILNVFT